MKFIELNQQIKKSVEPLYHIKGDDFFLLKQAINILKSALIKDLEEFNYSNIDAEKMKKEQFIENASMLPIGNDYRLVVLNNPNQEVVKYLNKNNFDDSSIVVVCVNAENLTAGTLIDCSKLDKIDASKYILNQLSKNKLSIQEQALDYIIEATNGNMSKIVTELGKIIAYCQDVEVITIDIVASLVSNTSEYAIYMLTNAIDNKNYSKYQQILNDLSKSQTQTEIFSYMGKYFKRMQYISLNKNDDQLAKILNIKPYAIQMSRQNITKNGIKFYLELYQKYINLDQKIKSGKISAANALYELIF